MKAKKLLLSKETVRVLESNEMKKVLGGDGTDGQGTIQECVLP